MKSPEQTRTQVYWRTTLKAIWSGLLTAFNSNKTSWVGLVLFLLVGLAAILAPLHAPYDHLEQIILISLNHAMHLTVRFYDINQIQTFLEVAVYNF